MGSTVSIALTLLALALLLGLALCGLVAVLLTALAALTGGIAGEARARCDYAADRDAILAAGRAIFEELGAREIEVEQRLGVLRGRRGPSVLSWGEDLTLRVAGEADASGRRRVVIESRSAAPGTRIDWGRNRRNAARIQGALDAALHHPGGSLRDSRP